MIAREQNPVGTFEAIKMARKKVDVSRLPVLEDILRRIDALPVDTSSFEMSLTWQVVFQGRVVSGKFLEALVFDRLLHKGLVPIRSAKVDHGTKTFWFKQYDPSTLAVPR